MALEREKEEASETVIFVFTSITDRVKAGLGSLRMADGVRVIVYVLGGRLSAPYGYTISESQDI